MPPAAPYSLVALRAGGRAVWATACGETMHPGAGPAAESESVYVGQLRLRERLIRHSGEFIVWDVGLGAAANALAVLRATRDVPCPLHLVSFDHTLGALEFALEHAEALGYLNDYEALTREMLRARAVEFRDGARPVRWEVVVGDFPAFLESGGAARLPAPHAICFDPFSPAKNPAMWTGAVFKNLFSRLAPEQPCTLATYSRSTIVRAALLLAGFFVGRGRPSGAKEETTVAANRRELLDEPLDAAWLMRARNSGSAEPLRTAVYRQMPLTEATWARLKVHPQFSGD